MRENRLGFLEMLSEGASVAYTPETETESIMSNAVSRDRNRLIIRNVVNVWGRWGALSADVMIARIASHYAAVAFCHE